MSALVLAIIVGMARADDLPFPFKITTKRETDKVQCAMDGKKSVISVHSPFGISQAVIERTKDQWPDDLVLRLHLKGLEKFGVSNGKVTINAAVSSDADTERTRLWKDGKEDSLLDTHSPYFMKIHRIGDDRKPTTTIPLKDGYFEMTLPKALFDDNPKSITIHWIDFYRS